MYKRYFAAAMLGTFLALNPLSAQTVSFTAPDTVCVGTPVNISNQSTGGASYYWQFCNTPSLPAATFRNLGTMSGMLQKPVFALPVKDGSNYYLFCVNHINSGNTPGNLLRFDYGSSLLNTPTVTNLGSMGVMPIQSEQLEIKKDGNNWYGILAGGGQLTTPQLVTIKFGTSLTGTPTAVNHGNVGNLAFPIGLHVFKEGNNWYAYVANRLSSSITRLSYGSSLGNVPSGINLSNIGNLYYPTTCRFIKEGSNWHAFLPNYGDNSLTRLDFGSSLLNTPTGTNLGNAGNTLHQPTDLILLRTCNELGGYMTNNDQSSLLKINFAGNTATGTISAAALGNNGSFAFPHSISEPVRMGDTLYSFIPNADDNTMSLMAQHYCVQPGIPSSTQPAPPAYSYSTPGTYTITLNMDEGTATQTTHCKQIVVVSPPAISITNGVLSVSGTFSTYQWYKNGVVIPGATGATYAATGSGDYYVKVTPVYCQAQSNTISFQGTGIHNVGGTAISIYPNPTADMLFIKSNSKVNAELRSIEGKKVMEQHNAATLRLGALAAGIYLLTVTDEHGQVLVVEKVVKQQ